MRRFVPSFWAVVAVCCWGFSLCIVYRIVSPPPPPMNTDNISLPNVRVSQIGGPEGHTSIAVDVGAERDIPHLLSFHQVADWNFDAAAPTPPPPAIQRRHGGPVAMVGFMFPLAEGEQISAFCLTATTQTCCYGPRPQFNQFALVECRQPVTFERLRPVLVTGTLYVEPKPQDGYILRIEADSVQPIGQQLYALATIDPQTPVLEWRWFERFAPTIEPKNIEELFNAIQIPPEIASLNGRELLVQGYQVGRFQFASGEKVILIGRDFWDGCCTGVPPTPFNSIPVLIAPGTPEPEPWLRNLRVIGTLSVRERQDWEARGIMALENSRLVAAPKGPKGS